MRRESNVASREASKMCGLRTRGASGEEGIGADADHKFYHVATNAEGGVPTYKTHE
jgi:hypothetical protein